MKTDNTSLIEILKNIDKYDWNKSIYCSKSDYSANTLCTVLTMDEALNKPENKDMHHVLSVSQAQDILNNLTQQILNPTEQDLMEAFIFFIQNDSYIVK